MSTPKRLWLIFAFIVLGIVGKASAQTWYVAPNTQPLTAADTAQLPYSVTFDFIAPEGWIATNGMTWHPVWPRNARGAWYRPLTYTQPALIQTNVFPWQYKCTVSGAGFSCLDLVRNIPRYVACPSSLKMGPIKLWRSSYNGYWPEFGLFTWGVFGSSELKTLPLQWVTVTNAGKTISCGYGNTTAVGAKQTLDAWVFYW